MSAEFEPEGWACLDGWWPTLARSSPNVRSPTWAEVFDCEQSADSWDDLDIWWQKFRSLSPEVYGLGWKRENDRLVKSWSEIDPWWGIYTETGHATAVEIADQLFRLNKEWRQSNVPFNTDPLAVDLMKGNFLRGPLRPSNEVGWSRWLARVLAKSPPLVSELFQLDVNTPPTQVIREDQLSKQDGSYRRPDILLFYEGYGVSIEVKLGDENYDKTAETARLVEQHYDDREWTHSLLLPRRKTERLSSIVEPSVEFRSNGQPQIAWEEPGPIDVIYWADITAAVRSHLYRGVIVDDHWAANAYMFCAVAEQQLLRFQSYPTIRKMADPVNVVDSIQPIQLTNLLEEQLSYLGEQ